MRVVNRSLVMMAALLLVAAPMTAQALGTLTGTARRDGAPLPGVTVTISSPALQGTRTAYTDVNGNFNFGALPPGVYTVLFRMESMQPVTLTMRVTLGGSARADASMRLSALEEAITVTASVPAAFETTEVQTNFQADMIADLPIGRTLQATTTLAPGVNTNGPNPGAITISGALAADNLFMVNGAVTNENIRGQSHNLFIEDAIQETTVQTAAISAEYGRFLGGVVNAVTRSGGNEFSGSLRNSLTNPDWTAKTPLPGQPDPLDNLNEVYAATLGGRIIRDRLWFFGAGRFFESDREIFLTESTIPFTFGEEQLRYEAKLTGQITDRHNLVASYLKVQTDHTNACFLARCYEFSNIDPSRSLPNDFFVLRYNGIPTERFLLEGSYTQMNFAFEDSGGDFRDRERGTWGYDVNTGAFFGAPVFCGFCDPEERNNSTYGVKGTYHLATEALGTHNIVAGYENWAEERIVNNYVSGSDFGFIVYNSPERAADGTILPIIAPGDLIGYYPILQLSQGSDFQTDSIYINDKWDLNQNLQFSLGVRYDVNDGKDSVGNAVIDDSIVSPRLGVMYDVRGDGRVRFNASYSKYANRIAENIGNLSSPGGSPAYFYYLYEGPLISGVNSVEAFRRAFAWFDSVGGLAPDSDAPLVGAGVPGVSLRIADELLSPNVDEIVFGIGAQLGRNGFARIDYITRDFKDFFVTRKDLSTGIVTDPFGSEFDLGFVENSNLLERTYDAVQLQGAWRFSDRLNAGANYTWSETRGNHIGQTAGGPIADAILSYPEFKAFAQHNPKGFLPQDQTHKVRAWVSFDLPTRIGDFNIGLLQNFDSGTPYSAIGAINTRPFVPQAIRDQYATPPRNVSYYFSDRGEFRWDDINSTDLALNYRLPIRNVGLFLQAQLLNAFNEDGQVSGNTVVLTHVNQGGLSNFNPFTTQPVEGVNFRLHPNFGRPTEVTHYQVPRTYQFSVGMRF